MSAPELHTDLERTATSGRRPGRINRLAGALAVPSGGGTYGGGRRKKNGEPCEPTSCGTSVHRVASAPRQSRASARGDECYTRWRMSHDGAPSGSTDPWSSIEPIGHRDDASAPAASDQSDQVDTTEPKPPLTHHELQRRMMRSQSNRDLAKPMAETSSTKPQKKVKMRPSLTVREVLGMNETMMKRFYRKATDDAVRPVDQKYAATGFAVAVDKYTILSARPQERASTVNERDGLRALAIRLLSESGERVDEGASEGDGDGCRESAG